MYNIDMKYIQMVLKGYFSERNENMCHLTVTIPHPASATSR